MPLADKITAKTTLKEAGEIIRVEASVVAMKATLPEMVQKVIDNPRTRTLCVVDEEEKLIGIIPSRTLDDDVFRRIVPEKFIQRHYGAKKLLKYLAGPELTAESIMRRPRFAKPNSTLAEVLRILYENDLEGIPIVDDELKIVGYVDMHEILAVWLEAAKRTEPDGK
ncbi:MAG: CBS domain-containing protein [Deltaproteobacteria bacterium]|nr:MAG: CBS domain-containing protein [Deltaproteobacteria bacterium]